MAAQEPPVLTYGGQAVLEGVMLRGPRHMAVAVRGGDGAIHVERVTYDGHRSGVLGWPLVRGVVAMVDSFVLGIRALRISARYAAAAAGEDITTGQWTAGLAIASVVAVGLFVLLPAWAAAWIRARGASVAVADLGEAAMRLGLLLGYLASLGRLPDGRRVFAFHGAEHKVIGAFEGRRPLTVAGARGCSARHPRCGTTFLLVVAVVASVLYVLVGWPALWQRLLLRVLLLPVVAGLAYEVLRWSARSPAGRPVAAAGLWLQVFTTREPDDAQLEVALAALSDVMAAHGVTSVA